MSSERKVDFSKLSDFEISILIVERDCAHYRHERLDELLASIGQVRGLQDAEKRENATEKTNQAVPGSIDLSSLPWRSYATKEAAKPSEAAWIFTNTIGAEALVAELKTKDKIQIGTSEYAFSGRDHQFISRKPLKEKT